jgi:hypothetical protein
MRVDGYKPVQTLSTQPLTGDHNMSDITFKDLYTKASTYAHIALAIVTLSDNAIYEMIGCMKAVKDTTGLDMKQEALLTMLGQVIYNRTNREDELTASEAAEQAAGC